MKRTFVLLAATSLFATPALAQDMTAPAAEPVMVAKEVVETVVETVAETPAPVTVTLPAETAILFAMDKTLASDKREKVPGEPKPPKGQRRISNVGDTFTMSVVNDVVVDGVTVVPAGAVGHGEVIYVTGKGGFGKSGKIEIKMNHVNVGDRQIPMQGEFLQKGKGRGGAAIAGTLIAGALAGVFIKGSEASIPLGQQVSFRTVSDENFQGMVTMDKSATAAAQEAAADAISTVASDAAGQAAADAKVDGAVEVPVDEMGSVTGTN